MKTWCQNRCRAKSIEQKIPSLRDFNVILNTLSYTDKIEHLFLVAIKFHVENEKTMPFNEVYTPIFEKNCWKPYGRSLVQLLSILLPNKDKYIINTFKHNAKTHSSTKKKKCSLYPEHSHIYYNGWLACN